MPKQIYCAYNANSEYNKILDYTQYKPTKLFLKGGGAKSTVKTERTLCTCPFCGKTGFANPNLGGILIEHKMEQVEEIWKVTECCSRFGKNNYETVSSDIYHLINIIDDLRVANAYGLLHKVDWNSYTIEQLYMAVSKKFITLEKIAQLTSEYSYLEIHVKNYFKTLKNLQIS